MLAVRIRGRDDGVAARQIERMKKSISTLQVERGEYHDSYNAATTRANQTQGKLTNLRAACVRAVDEIRSLMFDVRNEQDAHDLVADLLAEISNAS